MRRTYLDGLVSCVLLQVPGHAHVRDLGPAEDGHEGRVAAAGPGHPVQEGGQGPHHRAQVKNQRG